MWAILLALSVSTLQPMDIVQERKKVCWFDLVLSQSLDYQDGYLCPEVARGVLWRAAREDRARLADLEQRYARHQKELAETWDAVLYEVIQADDFNSALYLVHARTARISKESEMLLREKAERSKEWHRLLDVE